MTAARSSAPRFVWFGPGVPSIGLLPVVMVVCALFVTSPAPGFVRGDANADGGIDLGDVIFSLGYQFGGLVVPTCLDALDTDDDGSVTIADPIALANHLFAMGPAPAAPFPADGSDPTADSLGTCGAVLPEVLSFTTIVQGSYSGAGMLDQIIRTQGELDAFWTQFGAIFLPPPATPSVDFSTEMVIVVSRSHTSGGFSVNIDGVVATTAGIEIAVTFGLPLGGCPVTLALTQPHHIVRVPARPGVAIVSGTTTDTCP